MPIYEYRHADSGDTRDEYFAVGKAPDSIESQGRVFVRVRVPRSVGTVRRCGKTEDESVADELTRGYAHLERRGNLTQKGKQFTTRQLRHALQT